MATAQELVDLGDQLIKFARSIDLFIDSRPNPYASNLVPLRQDEARIAHAANHLAALAIDMLAADVASATKDLTGKVQSAQQILKAIHNEQKAANIVATVLMVAVAASTGNPFATAAAVAQLAGQVSAAMEGA